MKRAFDISLRLNNDNKRKLAIINDIIEEYRLQGYRMTLRQLYYQLVSRKVILNKVAEYQKLSILLGKGRMAGIVDWDAIEDRIRRPRSPYWYNDKEEAIEELAKDYKVSRMRNQNIYIEIWVEKDALSGVLYPITAKYGIPLMVNRGYSSITAMYDAYKRIKPYVDKGIKSYIIYMGDHDPSGLDMIRDVRSRILGFLGGIGEVPDTTLNNFMETEIFKELARELGGHDDYQISYKRKKYYNVGKLYHYDSIDFKQIALSYDQVQQYVLPPDPTKVTDPRAKDYIAEFGRESWELDALPPNILSNLLEEEIESLINLDLYSEVLEEEEKDKKALESIIFN